MEIERTREGGSTVPFRAEIDRGMRAVRQAPWQLLRSSFEV